MVKHGECKNVNNCISIHSADKVTLKIYLELCLKVFSVLFALFWSLPPPEKTNLPLESLQSCMFTG